MSAKRFQEAKVSQTLTGATFLLAEKGPAEGDWKSQCTRKGFQTVIFESTLLRIVFQKCASHRGRRAHFWNNNKNSGKIKTEDMKICFKMHAKAEVMLNRASKVGLFPLSRQNILLFAQHKAEMPLDKWWFFKAVWVWKQLLAHDICKNRSSKMCFLPRAGSTFS